MGTLVYGNKLEILWRYLNDGSLDLVYLDPPFNSAQNYHAFFHEKDGTDAAIRIRAGKRVCINYERCKIKFANRATWSAW